MFYCSKKVIRFIFTGWWFDACGPSNLNGVYHQHGQHTNRFNGIKWYYWKGSGYSLKATTMMIRPVDFWGANGAVVVQQRYQNWYGTLLFEGGKCLTFIYMLSKKNLQRRKHLKETYRFKSIKSVRTCDKHVKIKSNYEGTAQSMGKYCSRRPYSGCAPTCMANRVAIIPYANNIMWSNVIFVSRVYISELLVNIHQFLW